MPKIEIMLITVMMTTRRVGTPQDTRRGAYLCVITSSPIESHVSDVVYLKYLGVYRTRPSKHHRLDSPWPNHQAKS